MAPLDISDRINAAAMAGTWVGTLFTAIGLIAVFSQLRSAFTALQQSRKALITRSTGCWIALIPQKDMPKQGLVEKAAPGFLGWVQRAYIENLHACLTQDTRTTAGTSGWSNLFAQCGIQPTDLIRFGGPDARFFPAVTGKLGSGAARLADLVFDNGRVLYGFSQSEFTALLIICGFSPADFSISGCTTSTKFLGSMQLADNEPFSQVARFDAHEGCRDAGEDKERFINKVPIQTCLDYAIGVLRTPERGDHCIIIPADVSSTAAEQSEFAAWLTRPRAAQLNEIRYALEQLVSISGANVLKYSIETDKDIEYGISVMNTISPGNDFGRAKSRQILLIAHALAALQPWGLLPVLPSYFVRAFKPLIAPFTGSHSETVSVLQRRMCELNLKPLDGWDSIQQQAMALGHIGDIQDEFFSGSCSPCRNYYKAMNMVFDACKVRVDDVRNTLAALAARRCLDGTTLADELVPNLKAHLSKGQVTGEAPSWTVTVYATFLWGWLSDYIEMDFDFRGNFKRRVFLS
ncbi:MAG: hypothetical protein Q9201_000854 [Fulgogasparrea decipioides]